MEAEHGDVQKPHTVRELTTHLALLLGYALGIGLVVGAVVAFEPTTTLSVIATMVIGSQVMRHLPAFLYYLVNHKRIGAGLTSDLYELNEEVSHYGRHGASG